MSGQQGGIQVYPEPATHFVLTGPTSVAFGTAFSITVTVLDAYGNVATGYMLGRIKAGKGLKPYI